MDFQCPFCARWALRVDSLLAEYPDAVEVVTYHFPLTSHEFAVTAAVAVECADRQNEARAYQQVLLRDQHLIGTRPWEEFAREAGVADLDTFSVCVLLPADSFPRIAQGRMWGEKSGVRGTPTVWVNGEVHTPTLAQLRGMVERESAKGRH